MTFIKLRKNFLY